MNKSHQTQIEKYGGIEGYRAEMKRRRSLVKRYAFREDPELARKIAKGQWTRQAEQKDVNHKHNASEDLQRGEGEGRQTLQ